MNFYKWLAKKLDIAYFRQTSEKRIWDGGEYLRCDSRELNNRLRGLQEELRDLYKYLGIKKDYQSSVTIFKKRKRGE